MESFGSVHLPQRKLVAEEKLFSLFLTPFVLSPKGMLRVFNMTLNGRSHFGSMNVMQESRSKLYLLTFPVGFSIPIIFSNLNLNCSNLLDLRNLLQEVKKHSVLTFQCSNNFFRWSQNFWKISALNFKSFYRSQEQFFLTVGQNNFGNKIPLFPLVFF